MSRPIQTEEQAERDYQYAKVTLQWSGWGSPVGLGIALVSIGLFLWLLHLANLIK
ncbi:MAG TPA: hypothetical protein VLH38_00060 [Patescibacteria group bacterium]|nr:hypothetical protein [Patescibacteria group bacterium]